MLRLCLNYINGTHNQKMPLRKNHPSDQVQQVVGDGSTYNHPEKLKKNSQRMSLYYPRDITCLYSFY